MNQDLGSNSWVSMDRIYAIISQGKQAGLTEIERFQAQLALDNAAYLFIQLL